MSDELNESSTIEAPAGSTKKRMDPGFSRNLKIMGGFLGGLVVLVLVVILLRSGGNKEDARVSKVELGTSNVKDAGPTTPAQEEMLRAQQNEEAAAAAKRGTSYIPPDTVGATEKIVLDQPTAPTDSTYAQNAQYVNQGQTQLSESDQRRRDGLERQLAALLPPDGEATVRVRVQAEDRASTAQTGSANGVAAAASGSTATAATGPTLVPGLDIAAATLANDMVVPAGQSVFASAIVNSGPAKGAYMIGTAQVVEENLKISFTTMRLGDKTYKINAIVLDQQTASNAIAGDVDRRILARYVMPVTLAIAQGFFGAKAQSGAQIIGIGQEAAIVTPPSTTEQARSAGLSEGLKIAQQEVGRNAAKPIVVSTGKNAPVGVLFIDPVTETAK
jgi:hypothetical protein